MYCKHCLPSRAEVLAAGKKFVDVIYQDNYSFDTPHSVSSCSNPSYMEACDGATDSVPCPYAPSNFTVCGFFGATDSEITAIWQAKKTPYFVLEQRVSTPLGDMFKIWGSVGDFATSATKAEIASLPTSLVSRPAAECQEFVVAQLSQVAMWMGNRLANPDVRKVKDFSDSPVSVTPTATTFTEAIMAMKADGTAVLDMYVAGPNTLRVDTQKESVFLQKNPQGFVIQTGVITDGSPF